VLTHLAAAAAPLVAVHSQHLVIRRTQPPVVHLTDPIIVEESSKCRHVAVQDPASAAVIEDPANAGAVEDPAGVSAMEDPASAAAEILATTTTTPDATPPMDGNLARSGARIDHNRKRN
jgi:hypothetical protein